MPRVGLEHLAMLCRVNWREAKASSLVKTGDVISCAGKGRIQIDSMSLTAKGRHAIELTRYV